MQVCVRTQTHTRIKSHTPKTYAPPSSPPNPSLPCPSSPAPKTKHPAVDKVEAHCSDAVSKGATVTVGGGRPEGLPDKLADGNFFSPTVLTDATIDMWVGAGAGWGVGLWGAVGEAVEEGGRMCVGLCRGIRRRFWRCRCAAMSRGQVQTPCAYLHFPSYSSP